VTTPPQQPGQGPSGQPQYGGQPGQFAQPGQYAQPGPQGAPGQYGQPGQQGQQGQPGQGQFGQPGQQSQPGQYGQPGQQNQPGQFGQPASGQGPAFPAAGQGQAFPAAGQGPAFPAAGQGPAFPQQSTFGPAGNAGGGGFGPAMRPPRSRGRWGRVSRKIMMVRLIIGAVVVVAAIIITLVNSHTDPGNASVGDCIANLPQDSSGVTQDASDAKKVDCTDSTAAYKVLGVVKDPDGHDLDSQDSMQKTCNAWQQTTYAFEETESSNDNSDDTSGTVLCLTDVKH